MSQRINKAFVLLMALMLLISSTGWTMNLHFCQNQFSGVSLTGPTKSCHDASTKRSCNNAQKDFSQEEKDNCCENQQVRVEADDNDRYVSFDTYADDLTDDYVVQRTTPQTIDISSYHSAIPTKYRPPPLEKDVRVLTQVFRL